MNSGECIVGSKLQGLCRGNSPRLSTKFIVLQRYNNQGCILEGFTNCKIIDKVTKLSEEEYSECLNAVRKAGYQPKENIGKKMQGKEIFCEFQKQYRGLVFKSIIALGFLIRPIPKGKIYTMTETHMGVPDFVLK